MEYCRAIILSLTLLTSCEYKMTTPTEPHTKSTAPNIETSVDELSVLVSLPKNPKAVEWQLTKQPGGNDSDLTALLVFENEEYDFIVENSNAFDTQNNELVDLDFYHRWLQPHLPSMASIEKQGEFVILHGIHAMEPNLFTKAPNSPYIHGRIIPIGNGVILLSLYTM